MKQFNLQEYEEFIAKNGKAPKLFTRDGRSVRMICTDMKTDSVYVVLGLVLEKSQEETLLSFQVNGLFGAYGESVNDLFFADIEPIKKKVPLTYEDLQKRVEEGKTMWVKGRNSCSLITNFNNEGNIWFDNYSSSTEELMEDKSQFIDGDPCWKEVDE